MTDRNYASRHSIPPNIRFGVSPNIRIGIGIGGLITSLQLSGNSFRPDIVAPSSLVGAKRGLVAEIRRLREILTAAETEDDSYMAKEIELLMARIERLTEAL